jgi:hypothetical protein
MDLMQIDEDEEGPVLGPVKGGNTGFVQVDSWPNIAPVMDFCVVQGEGGGSVSRLSRRSFAQIVVAERSIHSLKSSRLLDFHRPGLFAWSIVEWDQRSLRISKAWKIRRTCSRSVMVLSE